MSTEHKQDWPMVKMRRKFPGLPRAVHATEMRIDGEYETYVPASKLQAVQEELERLAEVEHDERGELWRVGDAFKRAAQLLADETTEGGS